VSWVFVGRGRAAPGICAARATLQASLSRRGFVQFLAMSDQRTPASKQHLTRRPRTSRPSNKPRGCSCGSQAGNLDILTHADEDQ
jgi:hypothetical protein